MELDKAIIYEKVNQEFIHWTIFSVFSLDAPARNGSDFRDLDRQYDVCDCVLTIMPSFTMSTIHESKIKLSSSSPFLFGLFLGQHGSSSCPFALFQLRQPQMG